MQTINRHASDFCDCVPNGQDTPHTSPEQCRKNRGATVTMMNQQTAASLASSIGGGKLHAAKHDTHYRPQHGCPLCPIGSLWVRHNGEWVLPQSLGMVLPQE